MQILTKDNHVDHLLIFEDAPVKRSPSPSTQIILLDYLGRHDFLKAHAAYSKQEQLLLADHAAQCKYSYPDVPVAIWSIAKPLSSYPAYFSRETAAKQFMHAAHLMNTAGIDALVMNLSLGTLSTPQNEYARVVQAISWARAALPHIEIIPCIDLSAIFAADHLEHTTAWAQAVYDCAIPTVLWWAPPETDEIAQAFAAGHE